DWEAKRISRFPLTVVLLSGLLHWCAGSVRRRVHVRFVVLRLPIPYFSELIGPKMESNLRGWAGNLPRVEPAGSNDECSSSLTPTARPITRTGYWQIFIERTQPSNLKGLR